MGPDLGTLDAVNNRDAVDGAVSLGIAHGTYSFGGVSPTLLLLRHSTTTPWA